MSDLGLMIRTEWRLLSRGPMLWILALAAGLAYLVYTIERYDTNVLMFPEKYGFLYTGPLTVGAVLSGIYAAKRDRAWKAERIMEALPYRSVLVLPVKAVMAALPYIILNLVPAVILLYQWNKQLDSAPGIGGPVVIQLVFALGMLYPVVLGWMTGALFPGKLSYFLGFLVWLIHAYGGLMLLNVYLPEAWYALPNFMLFDYNSMGYLDVTWGYLADAVFWLHRALYFGLTALLLLVGVQFSARRRREPLTKKALRIGTGALALLVLLTAAGYIGIRSDRVEGYRQWEREASAQLKAVEAGGGDGSGAAPFRIASYKLNVGQPGGPKLAIKALLELKEGNGSPLPKLDFTLHPNLKVTAAKVNGADVPFEKDGYRLTLLPSSPLADLNGTAVELFYEGRLAEWKLIHPYGGRPESKLERSYRATEKEWYLPGTAAWYPLPGLHALARPDQSPFGRYSDWTEEYPPLPDARFEVSVQHAAGLKLFSNGSVQAAKAAGSGAEETVVTGTASGLALLAGPLQEIRADGAGQVRLITGTYHDPAHGTSYLNMLRHDAGEMNRILGLRPAELVLLPVDPSTDRGGRDLGGIHLLGDTSFPYSEADSLMKSRSAFARQYLGAVPGLKANSYWLYLAISAYLRSEGLAKPVLLDTYYGSSMADETVRLQEYMNSHSREEVEGLLRNMYEWIRTHEGRMKVDDVLK